MIIKILLPFLLVTALFGAEDSWYKSINPKIEAGILSPNLGGDISNVHSKEIGFASDLGYVDASSSYFSLEMRPTKKYVPNIYINFFNLHESSDITLDRNITVADREYENSHNISADIEYYVVNVLLSDNFILKGKTFSAFGKRIYTGDLEFSVGLDVKYIDWTMSVENLSTTDDQGWIEVNELIPLPYLGFKYYWYDLLVYADISSLSLQDAKSTYMQAGIDYRIVNGLSLSLGYVYEDFDIKEDDDTVNFETDGVKASFKYAF